MLKLRAFSLQLSAFSGSTLLMAVG